MTLKYAQATRQAACNAVVDLCDAGGAGSVVLYTGSEPDVDSAATGTLLGTLALSNPAFGSADSAGTAAGNSVTDDSSADASGTATYFRILSGAAAVVFQGSVGLTGSGADMEISSHPVLGEPISITSMNHTTPETQS